MPKEDRLGAGPKSEPSGLGLPSPEGMASLKTQTTARLSDTGPLGPIGYRIHTAFYLNYLVRDGTLSDKVMNFMTKSHLLILDPFKVPGLIENKGLALHGVMEVGRL